MRNDNKEYIEASKIYSLGIMFNDNDFYTTIMPFMNGVIHLIDDYSFNKKEINKDLIANIFNESIYGYYILYQNRFEYQCFPENLANIKKYLKIDSSDIYINEEVVVLIGGDYCPNGEFFLINMPSKEISVI